QFLPFKGRTQVVGSSIHFLENSDFGKEERIERLRDNFNGKLLLCMREYYSHKNLEILIPVAEIIKTQNLPYKILITVHPALSGVSSLLKEITSRGLNDYIINLGRVAPENIPKAYHSCDALLLPTLLESFGIPYLEAAQAKLPI